MPSGLKRFYGQGHLHFITFSCYHRLPFLDTNRARDVIVSELSKLRAEMAFLLFGYVVMPEHVHLLISEPQQHTPSLILHNLKIRVRHELRSDHPIQSPPQFPEVRYEAQPFWQARFYDFNVYSKPKFNEKLHYMHTNPVDRQLVAHPKDWPWSSWSFYAGQSPCALSMDVMP